MKHLSLTDHDAALAAVIRQQNQAADALAKRRAAAQQTVAAFSTSPTEAGIGQAIAAQNELAALATIEAALPDPSRREAGLRDSYAARNRDELLDILTADLSARLKPRAAWRRAIAGQIARLSETLALREAPQGELAAASTEADRLDGTLANSDHAEREARRSIATFHARNAARASGIPSRAGRASPALPRRDTRQRRRNGGASGQGASYPSPRSNEYL
jgi:hypothetical protein